MKQILLFVSFFFILNSSYASNLFNETFDEANGSITGIDVNGINWASNTDNCTLSGGDKFEVQAGEFSAKGLSCSSPFAVFTTSAIDVTTINAFDISMNVTLNDETEAADFIRLQYSTDSITFSNIEEILGDGTNQDTAMSGKSIDVSSAVTLYIRVAVKNSANAEIITFDDLLACPSSTIVQLSSITTTVNEGDGTVSVCASILNPDPVNSTSVDIELTGGSVANDGTDITTFNMVTLTFPGNSTADQCADIIITDDAIFEGNDTLVFSISNQSGGNNATIGSDTSTTFIIKDDDGVATFDIDADAKTGAEAEGFSTSFVDSLDKFASCAANETFIPAFGEVSGNDDELTGSITGLKDPNGVAVTATFEIVSVAKDNPLDRNLWLRAADDANPNTVFSSSSTMQSSSPKPTNLFASHFSESVGSYVGGDEKINAVEITFGSPQENFGVYLGDLETSPLGKEAQIILFDANNIVISQQAISTSEADPADCGNGGNGGAANGNNDYEGCGNKTTHWVSFTKSSPAVKSVLIVVGDDDNCANTSACDGDSEHLSFGGVIVGGECQTNLPISLHSLTATRDNVVTVLNWNTATEKNNLGFHLQRSQDAKTFETIGFVYGAGTSLETNLYDFVDDNPFMGMNYYRLIQEDFDGNESFTDVVSVNFDKKDRIHIYPTITNDAFFIKTYSEEGRLSMYNTFGQLVKMIALEGDSEVSIKNLQAGAYFVVIKNNDNKMIYTGRIIKQ